MNMHIKRRHHNNGMQNTNNNNRRQGQGRYNNNNNNNNNNGGGNGQRPRKNYAALREKFMNQARDAMASGDRVLAEYYLQHADHYYRMQQEFMEQRSKWREQQQAQQPENAVAISEGSMDEDMPGQDEPDMDIPNNSNVLPAFLTRPAPTSNAEAPKEPVGGNWEEE
jgi:hypothetical protein